MNVEKFQNDAMALVLSYNKIDELTSLGKKLTSHNSFSHTWAEPLEALESLLDKHCESSNRVVSKSLSLSRLSHSGLWVI